MNTTSTVQRTGDEWVISTLRHGYARVAAAIAGFGYAKGTPYAAARATAEAEVRAARMFAQALREDSNLEMDWLWCAANMTGEAQRRYCLERALAINPSSDLAKRALAALPPVSISDDALLFTRPADQAS